MTHRTYSSFDYQKRPTPQRPSRNYLAKLLVLATILLVGLIGFKIKQADHAAALADQARVKNQQSSFAASVRSIFNNDPGVSYSVSVADLNSASSQNLGDPAVTQAASVGKLLTASLYLHEVENGQASLSQNIGGNSAKYELKILINQSDDTAWAVLNDWLGHGALDSYARQLGLNSYNANDDTISTADVAKLLAKLYERNLLNESDTKLLLSWMQNTNYEDFISPAIPSGYSIYHKVGLIDDNVNDAAIITHGDKALILVIFTDGHGIQNWDQRAADMQQVAKAALSDYLN